MGRSGGRASSVTPPISMPVSACVSGPVAKDARETSMSRRTVWLTSRRVVASTRQAQYRLGSFFEATTMVLPEWSSGTPYFSQKAAVSAKSGSMRITSYGAPRASRAAVTFRSMSASSLMEVGARSGRAGSGLDLDEAGIVRRGSAGGRAVVGQHVGRAARVEAGGIRREPGALLDRDHAARDPVRDPSRDDRRAALVEDAHRRAVGDAAGAGVLRVNPDVVPVGPRQDVLIVVGRV